MCDVSNALVSIIVPVYNVEKYLSRCIESIISQTHKNLEIILVDDGATDGSGNICDTYKEKDFRIIVIHQKNGGVSAARNSALDIAKGEYICFVDSDDIINSKYVEGLLRAAIENNCSVAQCQFKYFKDGDLIKANDEVGLGVVSIRTGREECAGIYKTAGVKSTVAWSKIYHKSIWEQRRFTVGKVHEDLFITYEILYNTDRIADVDQELYYYRRTPNSIMNGVFDIKRLQYFEALDKHLAFYLSKGEMELFANCMDCYLYGGLIYTHLTYVKKSSHKKQMRKIIYDRMKKAVEQCENHNIPVANIYKLYFISPFIVANGYELKKRVSTKIKKLNERNKNV